MRDRNVQSSIAAVFWIYELQKSTPKATKTTLRGSGKIVNFINWRFRWSSSSWWSWSLIIFCRLARCLLMSFCQENGLRRRSFWPQTHPTKIGPTKSDNEKHEMTDSTNTISTFADIDLHDAISLPSFKGQISCPICLICLTCRRTSKWFRHFRSREILGQIVKWPHQFQRSPWPDREHLNGMHWKDLNEIQEE